MINKKDKRGQFGLFLIIGAIVVILIFGLGIGSGLKFISIVNSIPVWGWILILFLLILFIGRKKK